MRENGGGRETLNCLVCPGFLLPQPTPVSHPFHQTLPPHPHSLTPLHTPPLPFPSAGWTLSSPSKAQDHTPSRENQDLKMRHASWSRARQMAAPGVSSGRQEKGCQHPTWLVWQPVTESQPGRDWISETGPTKQCQTFPQLGSSSLSPPGVLPAPCQSPASLTLDAHQRVLSLSLRLAGPCLRKLCPSSPSPLPPPAIMLRARL